jgi:DNA-binding transcriptional LysR family regulator
MSKPDLNLLYTLDVLLAEGSVARAAERLQLSPSAMSRALARLRATTGDPLLVRAGRGLVHTPRALELRQQIGALVQNAEAALRPAESIDLATLVRTFTVRTRDGFVENFGPGITARICEEATGVQLRFIQKQRKESTLLRDGSVDLETGVVSETTGPEVRAQSLFRDRFVGVVRMGHPLSRGRITPARYSRGEHILVSWPGMAGGQIDEQLRTLGLDRRIPTIVDSFAIALALARASDMIASVPEHHTGNLRSGMHTFSLPVSIPDFTVSMLWHPRLDADPAHRWFRECVRDTCAADTRSRTSRSGKAKRR